MPVYYVFFVDQRGNVYPTHQFESDDDVTAIDAARRLHPPRITTDFEVWQDDRLVYRERSPPA